MNPDRISVTHNEAEGQFEATLDGATAVTEYTLANGVMVFTHTEVPPALEGHGVGNTLVRTALEHARAENLAVWPVCPFVTSFLRRHPEFQDLVSTRARS